jgi:hypothetical protein
MSSRPESTVCHDDLSRRAYTIWERNGRPDGNEQEHWYLAERELMQTGVPSIAAEIADDPQAGMAGQVKGKIKR